MIDTILMQNRIRILRLQKGESQETCANAVGTYTSRISAWEHAKEIPHTLMLDCLADHFNVSVDYLMGRTDEKRPNRKRKMPN